MESQLHAANRLLAERAYDAADQAFRAVLAIQPHRLAWLGVGECELARGRLDAAVAAFEETLSLQQADCQAFISLADAMLWRDGIAGWEHATDRALTTPITPPLVFHFLVRKACIHWFRRNPQLCGIIVQSLAQALKQQGEPLARLLSGYTMSTARNLSGLLANEKNGLIGRYSDHPHIPPVHLVGDSHCIAPAVTIVNIGGRPHRVRPHYILGCKAWHLSVPGRNGYKAAVERVAATLPAESQVILSAGDIDCRWRSGIFNLHRKTGAEIGQAIAKTIAGYLDFVQGTFSTGGHALSILAPPAPWIDALPWDEPDRMLVATIIGQFQHHLQSASRARGLRLIDTYRLSAGADGWSNRRYHVDTYHLDARALDAALSISNP